MKALQTFILLFFVSALGFAQNGINYKALIKDTNGNVIANEDLDIVFSIQHEGVTQYSELQQIITDNNGIAIATIGVGSPITGTFNTIDWKLRQLELNVQIDFGDGLIDFGNSPFNTVPYAINTLKPQGLESIDEGNGIGWRLANSNSGNHGNIGQNALDFSEQPSPTSLGATGELSVAFGQSSEASGYSSFAMGNNSRASGEQSFAFGENITTTGNFSIAFGFSNLSNGNYSASFGSSNLVYGDYCFSAGQSNQISNSSLRSFAFGQLNSLDGPRLIAFGNNNDLDGVGDYAFGNNNDIDSLNSFAFGNNNSLALSSSFAFGFDNILSSSSSYAFGFENEVSIHNSFVIGRGLTTNSPYETVLGRYNTTYTPNSPFDWNYNDRLFVIGNGIRVATPSGNSIIRSNALTILKNGNTGIGVDNPQEILHINGGRLRIGTETIEDGGSDILAFSSSLVPTVDNSDRLGGPSRRWQDVYAVNGAIQTSDRRSKTNIENLNYGLSEILQMQPVSFNWKSKNNPDTKLGLIAQDLLQVIPEVVKTHDWTTDDNGNKTKKELDRLGVYYSDLIPVLIKAIQEQQKIIENEKFINSKQNAQLEALLSRIENLESNQSN